MYDLSKKRQITNTTLPVRKIQTESVSGRKTFNENPSEEKTESKVQIKVLGGITGFTLSVISLVLTLTSSVLNDQGIGNITNLTKPLYILGENLIIDRLYKCGTHCYLIGDYQINVELELIPNKSNNYEGQGILPWYLELYQGDKPGVLEGKIPQKEFPKTRPNKITEPVLPLPNNITPPALRVVDVNLNEGLIVFLKPDKNLVSYKVRDRYELEKYELGSSWVLRTDLTSPYYLASSIRLDTQHSPFRSLYSKPSPLRYYLNPKLLKN